MFLEKDEHIILMDVGKSPSLFPADFTLPISDLIKLESAGIKTVYLGNLMFLDRNWDEIYRRVDTILAKTDLKILLPFWETPLHKFWQKDGEINYTHPDLGKSIDDATLEFLDARAGRRVQLIYAYQGGEFPWNPDPFFVPSISNEELAEFVVERQKLLSAQHNEVWTLFHEMMGLYDGNKRTQIVNNALLEMYPDCEHYRVMFAYKICFTEGHDPEFEYCIRKNPKAKYFVGSEYVSGMEKNYPAFRNRGAWGYVTAVQHPDSPDGAGPVKDWMLEEIRKSVERFKNERSY